MDEAALISVDGSIVVRVALLTSKEKNWLNYSLKVVELKQSGDEGLIESLSLPDIDSNYLQLFPENEVTLLRNGINSVISAETDYMTFSPVDEKDFIFELASIESDSYKVVSLFVAKSASYVYHGVRFKVDINALRTFADQLVFPDR